MTPLVEFRNIVKTFGGVHAVENVSLDLAEGEVLGLLGHNGAGKSTPSRSQRISTPLPIYSLDASYQVGSAS
jgi:ABC-type uncharacterized transport system ATPase subunit